MSHEALGANGLNRPAPVLILVLVLLSYMAVPRNPAELTPQTPVEPTPVIAGWGGSHLAEASRLDIGNPPSLAFPGETASDLEMQVRWLVDLGLNGFRVGFESQCTLPKQSGPYSSVDLERSFRIAERFKMWIIIDYHGYNDTVTVAATGCWLSFWNQLMSEFKNRYELTVWEPLNEPTGFGYGTNAVPYLSYVYQTWINQTRSLGDTGWIVVQNLCSYRCDFENMADGYPRVRDPLGKVFISLHTYMSYKYFWKTWDNRTAEAKAYMFYNAMKNGVSITGWPVLNTEGGPGGTFNGTSSCPDLVASGSAGYCRVNFHFMQTMTSLLDGSQPAPLNWIWWTMSGTVDTPGTGIYGALRTWGRILSYRMVRPSAGDVNKDFRVDIFDFATMAGAFGSTPGMTNWNPDADVNHDDKVSLVDFTIAAPNWQAHY